MYEGACVSLQIESHVPNCLHHMRELNDDGERVKERNLRLFSLIHSSTKRSRSISSLALLFLGQIGFPSRPSLNLLCLPFASVSSSSSPASFLLAFSVSAAFLFFTSSPKSTSMILPRSVNRLCGSFRLFLATAPGSVGMPDSRGFAAATAVAAITSFADGINDSPLPSE